MACETQIKDFNKKRLALMGTLMTDKYVSEYGSKIMVAVMKKDTLSILQHMNTMFKQKNVVEIYKNLVHAMKSSFTSDELTNVFKCVIGSCSDDVKHLVLEYLDLIINVINFSQNPEIKAEIKSLHDEVIKHIQKMKSTTSQSRKKSASRKKITPHTKQ